MTFVAGELAARIRLEGQEAFNAGLKSSGREFTALQSIAQKAGAGLQTTLKAAGTATDVATVAVIALGTKVFSAGVAYNTLQQTSRAALKTLLGGAEAANAQMDKLDAFAKNSPFSKAVFIQAQQQLIGFGMAADKVLPTLDAIQQSVAATGGNNETISALTGIIAKIGSSAKITAEDLNMFGERGIDAATLIGTQMGLTGQEIREQITSGTLDAGAAVDALVAGMGSKFAGASAGVKATMDGASDRVKAATRDIGAALAEPFVSKNGGGRAVDWANQLADLLRAVEKQTTPFTAWAVGKLNPAFANFSDLLSKAQKTVQRWDAGQLDNQLARIAGYAPALGLTAGVIASYGPLAQVMGRFGLAVNPVVAGLAGLIATSPELRSALADLLEEFEPLEPVAKDLAKTLASTLGAALPIVADGIGIVADVAGPVVEILSDIPAPVLLAAAAMVVLGTGMRAATAPGTAFGNSLKGVGEHMALQKSLAAASGTQIGTFGSAAAVAGARVTGLGLAMKTAFLSNPIGIAITVISLAAAGLTAVFASQSQAVEANRQRMLSLKDSLDQTTGAMTEASDAALEDAFANSEAYDKAKQLGLGIRDLTGAAKGQTAEAERVAAAVAKWNEAHTVLTDSGPLVTDSASSITQAVKEQAVALRDGEQYIRARTKADRDSAAQMDETARSNQRMNDALAIARDVSKDAAARLNALKDALDELNGGTKSAAERTRDLNEQTDRLGEAFAVVDEKGNRIAASLVSASGAIDTTTAAGRSLFDEVTRLNDGLIESVLAADEAAKASRGYGASSEEAAAAAKPYLDSLREVARQANLSDEQIDGLIKTMTNAPELIAFAVTDDGTIDAARLRAIDLALQVDATPDKSIIIDELNSPGIIAQLSALNYKVVTLDDGTVQVTAVGIESIEERLNTLTHTRYVQIQYAISQGTDPGVAKAAYENGGLRRGGVERYENGGIRVPGSFESFANGGYPSGVYKGRPGGLIMFAEQVTGREAFISDKVGQEARNRASLDDVAPWFNATVVDDSELARMRAAAAMGPAGVGAASGVAAAPVAAGPTVMQGQLVLESGELVGMFTGILRAELEPDPEDELFNTGNERPRGGI